MARETIQLERSKERTPEAEEVRARDRVMGGY
jgi:hypothetical protein